MAGEWREVVLSQLGRIVTGKTPPSNADENFGGDIPFVTPSDFDGRREIGHTKRYLTELGASLVLTARVPLGSIMVSCIGSQMGKSALAARECVTNQQINSLIADAKNDALYLYYSLSTRTDELRAIASGSAQPILNKSDFGRLKLLLPSLSEQREIARILGTLDDKIELNRRMNETLEAMARALFKSWFVDFDPVCAKTEGREAGLSDALANLFSGSFEATKLGEIPKGWNATKWGDLVSLEYGKSLSGYAGDNGKYPAYGTNGRIGSYSEALCRHPGIIVGRKGAYRGVHYSRTPFFVIDTAFYVEPKKPLELRWAYYEMLRQDINNMDSGSAIPSTSREDFYDLPVVEPPIESQQAFVQALRPCWTRQARNNGEAHTLAALRDTMLPKLISGELRVKEAERVAEAVA